MDLRQYLKKNQHILLWEENREGKFKRNFKIIKMINEGASAVCYEAHHENSGRGVLKEFYPKEIYGLKRNPQGQLVHPVEFQGVYESFLKAENQYLESYKTLLDLKQNGDDQELATFIPSFEIYYGCGSNDQEAGTVYIWTPEPKLEVFETICDEIHKHPSQNPEHKLVTVLNAIESLTKCVCALHSAGMVHRDINPGNFGFVKRGGETLTQTLSMFDINSICSIYAGNDVVMGTEGYMEPEAFYEDANNQTDIYSIGATLFHAIIVTDEVKKNNFLYRQEDYQRLQELVNTSALIQSSEANSHPRLRNILTVILQKCLCERTYRYANCEALLDDLQTALYYALPSEIAQKRKSGERWVLTDLEKSLDVNKEKNSFLAIQYHLYEYPLYRYLSDQEERINVLVIGLGNYGQKFLDACLQVGQMWGKTLNVSVLSDDATDKELYLSERPELSEFFNIDGSLADGEDIYGNISFEIAKLKRDDPKANSDILQNTIFEHCADRHLHYIFIALGEDELNFAAANAMKETIEVFEMDCYICYVCENIPSKRKSDPHLYPLYVNAEMKQSRFYSEIERMAFNTHLVWEKNLNIDFKSVRAGFRKTYNHDSSISSVLSLKYKLYSVNIDLDQVSLDQAARLFNEMLAAKSNRSMINELIWVEHRRWVTEKLCLGWRRIRNLEECLGGNTKDEKRKRHVCILRSRPDQKLAAEYKKNHNYEKWDAASSSELNQLDELDRMSVELHRVFAEKAKMLRKQNLLAGSNIATIRTFIESDKKSMAAFSEWYACMKDILHGDTARTHLYKGLKQAFLNAVSSFSKEKKRAVEKQVKAFETIFYPVLASTEYRDWKQDDVKFIEHIPFILTYTENACLVIPYKTETNTELFENVAAPTVANPSRILYLCLIDHPSDVSKLMNSVPHIIRYLQKKQLRAAIEFVVAYLASNHLQIGEDFKENLRLLGEGKIKRVKLIELKQLEDLPKKLETDLKQKGTGKTFFAVEKNNTNLSISLQIAGFYRSFASYQFDSKNIKFHGLSHCDMLGYIRKKPFLTVADMTAFQLSLSESNNQPEFFDDYNTLWKLYTHQRSIWKMLCDSLSEYAKINDVIALFQKRLFQQTNTDTKEYHYRIPLVCQKSAAKIIHFLKNLDMVGPASTVYGDTTDSCEVIIEDRSGNEAEYDKLFSNVYALMDADAITPYLNTKSHEVKIVFDNLIVSNAQISGNRSLELLDLMATFADCGYVHHLVITQDKKISFTYATRQLKQLFTTAGKILEVYTYHKAKELGLFDDVVCSYEINWEGSEVKSEFDCILTKGFRTLFVECKARSDIEQEFYYRLAKLRDKFGINTTAVLVADTQEKSYYDNAPINTIQRKRGDMMDVITVWKPEEISNIGHTLLRIMNENYVSKEK